MLIPLPLCSLFTLLSKQLDASKNAMGTASARAFGDMLPMNKTIQTLDVSDNSFGKMQEGDKVKLKSSGDMCTVTKAYRGGNSSNFWVMLSSGKESEMLQLSDFEWESQVPALCAGVAASSSLLSVSTIFRHALAVSISHSSLLIS